MTGTVQGVGFRPFVHRTAQRCGIAGWVRNDAAGVELHAEGAPPALEAFLAALRGSAPPAATIASLTATDVAPEAHGSFAILESGAGAAPTARIAPDLAICDACLRELFDPRDRRYRYPYVTCTDCGPRYSIVLALPYDRARTTMRDWPLCAECAAEYGDPASRRFHAEPIACPACGPAYRLERGEETVRGDAALVEAARLLASGAIVALKGIGGYHLACDARDPQAVAALRARKIRKERPFAVLARDLATAERLVALDEAGRAALVSAARPIVLAPARVRLAEVAPENDELGVFLPYAPLHHLLFADGAPDALVMTSANRSSEPLCYDDADARSTLGAIADAFLVGERPIARRVDDSVVRSGPGGLAYLRRARGLAPAPVAELPARRPILALGADLKAALALVVGGAAFASQHVGDLEHAAVRDAYRVTLADLCAVYRVDPPAALVVHDAHPGYWTTRLAEELGSARVAVQHHRAHVASVLAERGAWDVAVLAFAFDGTGYGDDGTIWGGEVFTGSLAGGLVRSARLRTAALPGGDAAARFPVQAAAGFLAGFDAAFERPPFAFPVRFARARELVAKGIRTFPTSSIGRLFDAVAALAGFVREQTFEGQAAMWLEHLARAVPAVAPYPFPWRGAELDYVPLLEAVVADRLAGRAPGEIARAFHGALAGAIVALAAAHPGLPVVASGGVFQNGLLVDELARALGTRLWLNRAVPPSDGGICLGQAALAAFA